MSTAKQQDLPVILHNDHRGLLTIEDGRLDVLQLSRDGRPPKRLLSAAVRNILLARLAPGPFKDTTHHRLDIHTLIDKPGSSALRLSKMHVLVPQDQLAGAPRWVETAMHEAYGRARPFRRVLLLVNPVGGKGKGRAIVKEQVMPLLDAAGCMVDIKAHDAETKHRNHAQEIAQSTSLDYDVIATVSGDGLVYEVLNGLAARSDAKKALRIPIAPIPTGSANALSINLLGVKDTFNIELACLNLIKGSPMGIDLASVLFLPSLRRQVSFLSIALGLMVDLDLGTENMRWMGDTRFILGFLRGVAASKNFRCRLQLKVVQADKVEMARAAREAVGVPKPGGGGTVIPDEEQEMADGMAAATLGSGDTDGPVEDEVNGGLAANGGRPRRKEDDGPLLTAGPLQPDESWLCIDSGSKGKAGAGAANGAQGGPAELWIDGKGILYVYAGMMPWVARDLNQWPVAQAGQGLIDVVVQEKVPRTVLVSAITGAEKGEAYWIESQRYYKCSAFTAENLDPATQKLFTLDGEGFSFTSFHVEVLPLAANVMSMTGHFHVSDFLRKHDQKE